MTAVEGRLIGIGGGMVARGERGPTDVPVARSCSSGCLCASCTASARSTPPCSTSPCSPAGCSASACSPSSGCAAALSGPDRVICRCLNVTESSILQAIASCPIRTLKDLCRFTQAGGGCMSCRRELSRYVEVAASAWRAEATSI